MIEKLFDYTSQMNKLVQFTVWFFIAGITAFIGSLILSSPAFLFGASFEDGVAVALGCGIGAGLATAAVITVRVY